VAKLSTGKATMPGPKQVWRRRDMGGDVIALLDEDGPPAAEPLLSVVMEKGKRLVNENIEEPRERFSGELRTLPPALRSLDPEPYQVERSASLQELADQVRSSIRDRELG